MATQATEGTEHTWRCDWHGCNGQAKTFSPANISRPYLPDNWASFVDYDPVVKVERDDWFVLCPAHAEQKALLATVLRLQDRAPPGSTTEARG